MEGSKDSFISHRNGQSLICQVPLAYVFKGKLTDGKNVPHFGSNLITLHIQALEEQGPGARDESIMSTDQGGGIGSP